MSKRNRRTKCKACCFCGLSQNNELEFGKLYEHSDIITHYYCLLLSSHMLQRGNDNEGILGFLFVDIRKEIRRGKKLTCVYCKKTGATLGCCNVKCKRTFHYPCGLRAGTLNQFFGEFRSYCISHRPKQKIDTQVKKELARTNEAVCYICYETVDPYDIVNTIWAPCCKKNAWFHRKCVQQLAVSAGYFFKCPLCNDKKIFQTAMLEFGIFIPSQDASWELVPNAFQELLYRHDQCDASECLCPKGRKYTSFNAKWELALCRTCGSQGIHMICGQLKWANPIWECPECISILGKSAENPNSRRIEDVSQNDPASDDSDSDISVGKDSPIPFASPLAIINSASEVLPIKIRPGPRTFKLKQLKANEEWQRRIREQSMKSTDNILCCATEEYGQQSTSNSALVNTRLCDTKYNSNITTEHSKSQLYETVENVITLDSDDDIAEVNNYNSLDGNFTITEDTKAEDCDLFQCKSNKVEETKTITLHDSSPLSMENVLYKNHLSQNDSNIFLNDNTENELKLNILDDSILNYKSAYTCPDTISNIKITNVISLASKDFKNASPTEEKRNIKNNERLNDILDTNLKRKLNETVLSPTISCADKSKRIKKIDRELTEASSSSNVPIHNFTYLAYNDSNLQIVDGTESNISANVPNLQNQESHVQVEQNCNTDILHASRVQSTLDISKNLKVDNTIKNCAADAGTSPAVESRNRNDAHDDARIDCREELVKSEQIQLPKQSEPQDAVEMVTPKRRTSSNKSNNAYCQGRNRNTECNYNRLIPEYIHLRDLKFRVDSSNNLQMILYDKFSVNINMENANAMVKDTRLDMSTKKSVQDNICKTQPEIPASLRSGNILQNISPAYNKDKTKCMLAGEHLEKYEDGKENLDPVTTISCKTITDNVLISTTVIANDSNASMNGSDQSENENLTQPVYHTIDTNNERQSHENIKLVNASESISDANTSCQNKFINSNCVNDDVRKLKCSEIEMRSARNSLENHSHDSIKLLRRTIFPEIQAEYGSQDNIEVAEKTNLKVSIDLKKIESFIDNNPDLFPRYKTKNNERREKAVFLKEQNSIGVKLNVSEHIGISSEANEAKRLNKLTLTNGIRIGKSRNTELRKRSTEIIHDTKDD